MLTGKFTILFYPKWKWSINQKEFKKFVFFHNVLVLGVDGICSIAVYQV